MLRDTELIITDGKCKFILKTDRRYLSRSFKYFDEHPENEILVRNAHIARDYILNKKSRFPYLFSTREVDISTPVSDHCCGHCEEMPTWMYELEMIMCRRFFCDEYIPAVVDVPAEGFGLLLEVAQAIGSENMILYSIERCCPYDIRKLPVNILYQVYKKIFQTLGIIITKISDDLKRSKKCPEHCSSFMRSRSYLNSDYMIRNLSRIYGTYHPRKTIVSSVPKSFVKIIMKDEQCELAFIADRHNLANTSEYFNGMFTSFNERTEDEITIKVRNAHVGSECFVGKNACIIKCSCSKMLRWQHELEMVLCCDFFMMPIPENL